MSDADPRLIIEGVTRPPDEAVAGIEDVYKKGFLEGVMSCFRSLLAAHEVPPEAIDESAMKLFREYQRMMDDFAFIVAPSGQGWGIFMVPVGEVARKVTLP